MKKLMATSKYNLEQLGWFNFEQLARTLLREVIGNGLSTFSGSVDQGRDATFIGEATSYPSKSEHWDGTWIFQVKHRTYSSRGADQTRAELKRTLAEEIKTITTKHHFECKNYVLITNCPLTSRDKDEMINTIRSSTRTITGPAVWGEADIQELLDCNPRVTSAFPQILGISQLRELIQWGLHQRSIEFLQAAQAEIAMFVASTPYLKAIDLLHKQHFCVLSGPPKMGKTCTAYALAASFSAQSFEVFDLRTQRDFYDAHKSDRKQLFICDDVFGDISMKGSQRDDWTRGFMRLLVSLGRDHKLVWTARESVLKEALSSSKLKEERPTLTTTDKVTVAVDELSRLEKAMILYNHAKNANLPTEVREFLRSDACIGIVDHPNYSPESIRQLCTGRLVTFVKEALGDKAAISTKLSSFLSRPGEAWKTAYLAAPGGEKLLCTEVMASGGFIHVSALKNRYENSLSSLPDIHEPFEVSFTNAQGTFLRKKPFYHDELVQFYHPSMRDLLAELIEEDKSIRFAYLKQLALKEVLSLAKPCTPTGIGGSEDHRIFINDKDDIDLLKDHINGMLLPQSDLPDLLSVLTDLRSTIEWSESTLKGRRLRESAEYPLVLWMIVDSVVPHACSLQFWQRNASQAYIPYWRRLFEALRVLLPVTAIPFTPIYIPEMLRRHKDENSVDYWGLVTAAHSIVPTIVEQCIDLQEREKCRIRLVETVNEAIDESKSLDLENNYDDSQYWHEKYKSVSDDCEDYESLFPEDEQIADASVVIQVFEDFPRLEQEPDDDDEHYSHSSISPSPESNADILEIFSDL